MVEKVNNKQPYVSFFFTGRGILMILILLFLTGSVFTIFPIQFISLSYLDKTYANQEPPKFDSEKFLKISHGTTTNDLIELVGYPAGIKFGTQGAVIVFAPTQASEFSPFEKKIELSRENCTKENLLEAINFSRNWGQEKVNYWMIRQSIMSKSEEAYEELKNDYRGYYLDEIWYFSSSAGHQNASEPPGSKWTKYVAIIEDGKIISTHK